MLILSSKLILKNLGSMTVFWATL